MTTFLHQKMAQVVTGCVAIHNLQKTDDNSDEFYRARVRRHMKDSYTTRALQHAVIALLDRENPFGEAMKPMALRKVAKKIHEYFLSQGYQADTDTIYMALGITQNQMHGRDR